MARETGGAVPHKGCNSSSCCSPAKLWRTIQTLIKENDKRGLIEFFKDARLEHIVRVALTSRISNDASMFPASQQHKLVKIHDNPKSTFYLGKSFTDLNSLQLALISSSESMVLLLLSLLKSHATSQELKVFVNHIYGQGNTSLHLAVFLKRFQVVKVLMELGCKLNHLNAKNKNAVDCCYYGDQQMMDLFLSKKKSETVVKIMPPVTIEPKVVVNSPKEVTMQQLISIVMKHVNKVHFNLIIHQLLQKQQQQQQKQKQKQKQQQELLFDAHYVSLAQLKKPPDITRLLLAY